jgi:flagellar hook-associated protein 2
MPIINFSGIASGIDTNALIQATSDATRQARITPFEKQKTDLEDSNESLREFKTLFETFRDEADDFGTLSARGIQKGLVSNNEEVITGTANSAASSGSYSVNVTSLARNGIITFNDRFTARNTPLAPAINSSASEEDRSVEFTVGSGSLEQTVAIPITSTTTVEEFVALFNQKSTTARANLVNVGSNSTPQYAVSISSLETGLEKGELSVSLGSEVSLQNRFTTNSLTQARDSVFSIVGVGNNISRSTNTITDVIPGLSLNLLSEGTTSVSVDISSEETTTKVKKFVEAYNSIITFFDDNNTVEREEDGEEVDNIFGSLAKNTVDENAVEALRGAIRETNLEDGSTVKIFADIGITTARDGTLEFDEDKFNEALGREPSSVENLLASFADNHTLTGKTISNYTRFGGLFDITIDSQEERGSSLADRISEAEDYIARQEQNLRARYARLESLIGGLQSQQNALTSALGS